MVFSNLLGDVSGEFIRNKGNSFPLVMESVDKVSDTSVRLHDGKILVTSSSVGTNIFSLRGKKDDVPVQMGKGFTSLTYDDIKDTEDNPLIVVNTKGIQFFNDIPTYLNVLFVNEDMMLVMLIFGACGFQFEDGSYVALQRCNDDDIDRKGVYKSFDCKSLKDMTLCKTKGGWDKSYDIVCPLFVRATNKGGRDDFSIRCIYNNAFILNGSAIKQREEYEAKKAEEDRIAREEAKRLAEQRRREAIIEQRKKQEEEMRMKKLEDEYKKKTKNVVSYASGSTSKRSAGAEAFLSILNGDN